MTPKTRLLVATACVTLVVLAAATPAQAQRGRGRGGRQVGPPVVIVGGAYGPLYDPWWWDPYPYGRYPRGVYFDAGAALRLQVTPRDAEVYLDGYLVGSVDDFDGFFQRLRLRPGPHELELYRDGFRTVRQRFRVNRGSTFRLQFTMQALSPGDDPDDRPVAERMPPPPPPRLPDPDEDRSRDRDPAPRPDSAYGSIAIRVQPDDAEILIDGEPWTAGAPGERLVVQVPAGRRQVEVRKAGLRPFMQDVNVRPGETVTLNVSLRPEGGR